MSQRPWERSGFGRSCLATLRKGLPKELYERELAALERLYATRSKISRTDSPPSSEDSSGSVRPRRPVSPRFASRSAFEQGLFRRLQEGLPPKDFEEFLRRWDAEKAERAKLARRSRDG